MNKSFFFIILFLFAVAILVHCFENNPHDFSESECVFCHQGDPSSPLSLSMTNPAIACANCHADIFETGYMHPYNIAPEKVLVPQDMPLSRRGWLTCNTCHNVHSDYENSLGEQTYFLRRLEQGRAFCDACHSNNDLSSSGGHTTYLGEAHFQSKYIPAVEGQYIDPMSKNCISCHDGSYGSAVTIDTGIWQHSSQYAADSLGGMHPIGVDYEMARLRAGRKTDLRPLSAVNMRVQFFEGTVGCGSCHNPYSQQDTKLVMSNARSALCFACHALDQ